MDRRDFVLKHIGKSQRGIEIGPWVSPLAPKRDGYNCLTLDVFDRDTLRKRASAVPDFAPRCDDIEEVDLLGSSTHIDQLVAARGETGMFDYIVSSHNFEHLANPIRFLQGCARVLKPGGFLSMAIPDHRGCFDILRPVTRLSDWIEAFFGNRSSPTFAQVFDDSWAYAHFGAPPGGRIAFSQDSPLEEMVTSTARLEEVFANWKAAGSTQTTEYIDAHCSVFTPSSFNLLISDSAYLGLTEFEVVETHDTGSYEFYVHLRLRGPDASSRIANYAEVRSELLRNIKREEAASLVSIASAEIQAASAATQSEMRGAHVTTLQGSSMNAAELRIAREKVAKLEAEIQELRASSSWRVTAPIRRVMTAMKR